MTHAIKPDVQHTDPWDAFVEAKDIADRSGARADIEVAARAWTNWLTDFIPAASERLAVPLPRFQRGHQ